MSEGIVELILVFGAVLALAVLDLMATKRATTSTPTSPPEPRVAPFAAKDKSRKAQCVGKPGARKPRTSGM